MAVLTPKQIAVLARDVGFRDAPGTYRGKGLTWAVAVALAESGGNPKAVNVNSDRWHSRDLGLWQINEHWHPDEAKIALDPQTAAGAAYRISDHGRSFAPWATIANGSAGAQLGRATLAVAGIGPASDAGREDDLTVPGMSGALGGIPNPLDAVDDVAGGVASLAKSVASLVILSGKAYMWIGNPHNMLRIAQVAGGALLVVVAVKSLAGSGAGPVADVAKTGVRAGSKVKRAAGKTVKAGAAVASGGTTAAATKAAKAAAATKGA